jgi:hypothetical protein
MRYARPTAVSALFGALAILAASCSDSGEFTRPEITAGSSVAAVVTQAATAVGIPVGIWHPPASPAYTRWTGTEVNVSPKNIIAALNAARAAHQHIIIKMVGTHSGCQNPDQTFNLDKWKTQIDAYNRIDLSGYVRDGTLIGTFAVDEPHRKKMWGGAVIPPDLMDKAAAYSKGIWPYLPVFLRAGTDYAMLKRDWRWTDAAWPQYSAKNGAPATYVQREASNAAALGLGLIMGMNVLDGGDGSSQLPGWSAGMWWMSPAEIVRYGTALVQPSYVCALLMWKYDATMVGRADYQAAFDALGRVAAAHPATSCVQRIR